MRIPQPAHNWGQAPLKLLVILNQEYVPQSTAQARSTHSSSSSATYLPYSLQQPSQTGDTQTVAGTRRRTWPLLKEINSQWQDIQMLITSQDE